MFSKDRRSTRRMFLQQTLTAGAAGLTLSRLASAAEPELPTYLKDQGWLVGCWTRPWADQDYRVAMDAVAEAGFKYLALTGAKTQTGRVIAPGTTLEESRIVGEEAAKRGLSITNVYGGGVPLTDGGTALRKMIDNCAAAEGWSVLLSNMGDEETFEECCRTVQEGCDYAAGKGLAIVLKPHGGTTGTGPQLRQAVERVQRSNFTVMYDPGNILYYSDGKVDPVEDCAAAAGLITGISVKDYRHPKEVGLTPGTGEVKFPVLMARLKQGGFSHGPMIVETLTPGDAEHTMEEAKKARQFVEKLLAP
ncbi:MAG: sugar phosphate isomerase/epimerase [Acidobacteriota bacterium]|nr:MAG: sugar phosphate isomerase/epimerase [Acidobacteriota bacterium]